MAFFSKSLLRMRELENEGIVEVKYVRSHAHYRFRQSKRLPEALDHGSAHIAHHTSNG